MTMRELGRMRAGDPEGYAFLEIALAEKNRRINEEMEKQ